jgi:hypothetical protein
MNLIVLIAQNSPQWKYDDLLTIVSITAMCAGRSNAQFNTTSPSVFDEIEEQATMECGDNATRNHCACLSSPTNQPDIASEYKRSRIAPPAVAGILIITCI